MSKTSAQEVIVRGILLRDGRVLANKSRGGKTGMPYAALPGGHLDPGESCRQAVAREFEEELGASIEVGSLCFVSESVYPGRTASDKSRHELVLYFHVTLRGDLAERDGRIVSPEASKNFAWIPLDQLDEANLLPLAIRGYLRGEHEDSLRDLYSFDDSTQR